MSLYLRKLMSPEGGEGGDAGDGGADPAAKNQGTGDGGEGGDPTPDVVSMAKDKFTKKMDATYQAGVAKAKEEAGQALADLLARAEVEDADALVELAAAGRRAQASGEELEAIVAKAKEEVQRELQQKHASELTKLRDQLAGANKLTEKYAVTQALTQIAKARGANDPEEVAALLGPRVEFDFKAEKYSVKTATGLNEVDGDGEPLTLDGLVRGFLESKPYHVNPKHVTGSGEGDAGNTTSTKTSFSPNDLAGLSKEQLAEVRARLDRGEKLQRV